MKEWRKINMKLGNRIAKSRDQTQKEQLRSQMISRRQARSRFKLESKIPSHLMMQLFERVGLITI